MYSIHLEKSTARAVSPVRKTRLLYFYRRRGVWLQGRSWDAAQAGRHALDRQGRQRHHRPALQQAQRTLPGFLGTPLRAKAGGRMTSLNLMCAHGEGDAVGDATRPARGNGLARGIGSGQFDAFGNDNEAETLAAELPGTNRVADGFESEREF